MFDNRDFTVCENCGGNCYLGNKYCEDCANELWEVECNINSDYCDVLSENELLKKALELACENICEDEFVYVEPSEEIIKKLIDFFKSKAKEKMKSE